eukprot:m.734359 g.734359  ORF g.734359 m.734359 type:complete len:59 (-) comp23082_c0_seq1:2106-2282(-)
MYSLRHNNFGYFSTRIRKKSNKARCPPSADALCVCVWRIFLYLFCITLLDMHSTLDDL